MLNAWEGIGMVVAPPTLIEYRPDQFLAKLRLGCSSYFFSKEKQRTEKKDLYITIQVWGNSARGAHERYPKGAWIYARGPLSVSEYTDRTGTRRTGISVNIGGYDTRLIGFSRALGNPNEDEQLFEQDPEDPSELFEKQGAKEADDEFV